YNCSKYKNDSEIIKSFPYIIHINSYLQYSTKTYALSNDNKYIYYMNIAYQIYIPSSIFCFKYLSKLEIRNTSFCYIDKEFQFEINNYSSSIIHLAIYDTIINYLSENIVKLNRLKTLELSNINLMSLPNSIRNLSSLNFLSLPYNKLETLPSTIKNLKYLSNINLKRNEKLSSIESLNGLKSLEILDARHCSIQHLLLHLSDLTNLYMTNNYRTDLYGIKTLGYDNNSKKYFYFDYYFIQLIPLNIFYVKNLYWLNLNYNRLDNLPMTIFNINTLSYLYIPHNNFCHGELKSIAYHFKHTNPNLKLFYLNKFQSLKPCST
ncbi:unnamed protein product, partial [Rotaria sp. Silwood2]